MSSLLKPIKQSNIFTQESKIVEKLNIFDIKTATIEHPKTVTKLAEPKKQRKIIIPQPNKIEVYTEPKTTGPTPEIDLIKK